MSFSFFPKTVYQTQSKISGEIVVKEHLGQYSLQVQNLTQSGGIIKSLWQKPLKKVKSAEKVLLLGLGGGTVIQLIKKRFPKAKITTLEIDREIIKMGKKYFGLDKIKNLKIINEDAIKWVNKYQGDKFDLILVDLYIGGEFLPKAMENEFLQKLKRLLIQEGIIIFNWLKNKEEKEMVEKIERNFSKTEKLDTRSNLFLFAG